MNPVQEFTARRAGRHARLALILLFTPLLSGCFLTTEMTTDPVVDVPPTYRAGTKTRAALPAPDWWRGFRSRELTDFVERAHLDNLDIAAAVARIEQADATTRIAGAPLLPTLTGDGSATRSGAGNAAPSNTFSSVLNASYEIDLWGKNRAALRAAEFASVASRFDREVIVLSTVATVINTYFTILASQDRLRIAHENVRAATRILNVYQERIAVGTATGLDIAQQQSLLAQQRAAIPPLDQDLRQNIATLAVLIGEAPARVTVRGGSLNSIVPQRVATGLPSDLLLQRPDIREAEAQLFAADANIDNARAAMFPSIQLTGQGGFVSTALKTLFLPESTIFSVAGSVTQPIFDGFRLLNQLEFQKARRTELLQIYRKSILSGFADVERALIAIRDLAEQERLQAEAVATARRAYELSESQLRIGTIDITTVLNTQRTLFTEQDQLVLVRLTRMQAIVSLFQALGGGWVIADEIAAEGGRPRAVPASEESK